MNYLSRKQTCLTEGGIYDQDFDEAGKSVVAAVDARAMLSVVGANDETLDSVATEVHESSTASLLNFNKHSV